jgi:hypothetical protein
VSSSTNLVRGYSTALQGVGVDFQPPEAPTSSHTILLLRDPSPHFLFSRYSQVNSSCPRTSRRMYGLPIAAISHSQRLGMAMGGSSLRDPKRWDILTRPDSKPEIPSRAAYQKCISGLILFRHATLDKPVNQSKSLSSCSDIVFGASPAKSLGRYILLGCCILSKERFSFLRRSKMPTQRH